MQQTFFVYLGRFFVFGFFYVTVIFVLATVTPGHRDDAMRIFVGGYLMTGAAAAAWLAAVILARIPKDTAVRFWAHLISIAVLFLAFGFLSVATFLRAITDGKPGPLFEILFVVMVAAMFDGAVGAWVDRRRAARLV